MRVWCAESVDCVYMRLRCFAACSKAREVSFADESPTGLKRSLFLFNRNSVLCASSLLLLDLCVYYSLCMDLSSSNMYRSACDSINDKHLRTRRL